MTDERADERRVLVDEIAAEAAQCARYTGRARLAERTMQAIRSVPRHEFVLPGESERAYVNAPLPIGHRQTISQPFIVALMTDLLDTRPDDVVLELGTGSGYQAAVLATLVRHVFTVEIVPELAAMATATLSRLGYDNVSVRSGDGQAGWPEHAPYRGIILTAACTELPEALAAQLAPGGRVVYPRGEPYGEQELVVADLDPSGALRAQSVLPVRFVPVLDRPPLF
ncbi:MAG: protein-L-isoaspartate(D-aspartate) O-methyltransferase [Betaproteobacteria bacterium]|nr:protein-L-isoaspartate(D-aspartate) O-methyltransferase [Betaproteobacteria bacterium]